ncbi:hypothetical protein CBR_g31134 [Chara braunii]|uniref:DDE Tnp4 domain-containing protein n=1 Tax=Chara braunii TaxID=69332 RepID=A0A388LEE2_CHABU|nr:hypothetical protein CBR_g31134 [Chara braunii]|eukprot:GBG80675.1 hypothetical protein CBR_g31134 [Chara braunii]
MAFVDVALSPSASPHMQDDRLLPPGMARKLKAVAVPDVPSRRVIMMRRMTAILLLLAHVSLARRAILGLPPLPRSRRRRFWVRQRAGGTWEELKMVGPEHNKKFREYTRLSRPVFQRILHQISPRIQRLNTPWRQALPVSMKFAFALYRWATGGYYSQCGNDFGMGLHSAVRCTEDVSTTLLAEYGFGRLKGTWRCFGRKHIANMRNVCKQFLACCILHNIIIDEGIPVDEELLRRQADEKEESNGDDDAPESDDSSGDDDPPDAEFDFEEALLRCEGSVIYASHRERQRVAECLRQAIHAHSDHVAKVFR